MKILKVRVQDAGLTEDEAERKFYALYNPIKETAKKNVKKLYEVLNEVHDTVENKKKTFEAMSVKLTKYGSHLLVKQDYETYPVLKKMKEDIGRMENMEKHLDFMIKELGQEFLAKFR